MSIQRKYLREHAFLLTVIRGSLDDRELKQHVTDLTAEAEGLTGLDELADCMGLEDVTRLSGEGIREAARLEAQRAPALKQGKLAIVVPTQLQYGLARMYQAICEPFRAEVRVFLEFDPALEWLASEADPTHVRALREVAREECGSTGGEASSVSSAG